MVPNIGKNFRFAHLPGIVIGDGAIIGNDCIVYHGVTIGQSHGLYPRIGNNVLIYPHTQILGGINIGDNVTILANSVVVKDIPSNTIVGGIPAKIIKQKKNEK
ncbi:MAG: hypothetical protein J6R12_01515 [Bacteroidales bacterium]|nr:hypothetical protein [Bacteroidales bacterium]